MMKEIVNDGLSVTEEEDGSLTIEWDKDDPKWEMLNDFTEQDFIDTIMENIKKYTGTVPVEVDSITGEYFITFPEEIIESLNWKEGDTIVWINNNDGTFTIKGK